MQLDKYKESGNIRLVLEGIFQGTGVFNSPRDCKNIFFPKLSTGFEFRERLY